MYSSLSISYAAPDTSDSGRGSIWARLEQEYRGSDRDAATLGDLAQMIAAARGGSSAYTYIAKSCPYATVQDDTVIISLVFYVWPSSLDLQYSLAADLGTILDGEIVEEHRSFDVPFQGSDSADLMYKMLGYTLVEEMPFINSNGDILGGVEVTAGDSSVTLSESAYCVLRADGVATGYKHTIEMHIQKGDNDKIENLKNAITVSWVDDAGEDASEVLELEIPPCVDDLLEECPDGTTTIWVSCVDRNCYGDNAKYVVTYNACNGEIISRGWEE